MNPIFEKVFNVIVRVDADLKMKFISDNGLRWFGGKNPSLSQSFLDLVYHEDHRQLRDKMMTGEESFSSFVRLYKAGKVPVWCNIRASYVPAISQYFFCIFDVSDHRPCDKKLMHAVEHDSLTGLSNRTKLQRIVESHIQSGKLSFSVVMMDLDGFKKVNDTLGHATGDTVLIETSKRLLKAVDASCDLVCRLGGDEFVIVLDNAVNEDRINTILSKIMYSIARPFDTKSQDAYLGCSVGIANYPEHGETYSDLLKNADTAMYLSKNNGKNRVSTYIETLGSIDFSIKSAINKGIQEGEFYLQYQPQYDRHDKMVGVEALMRWTSDTLGQISPEQFISVAEETGLMLYLGEWALRSACYQLRDFQEIDPEITMSVNVSPLQFSSEDFYTIVRKIIDDTGIDPSKLVLEITESTLMQSQVRIEKILNDLRHEGIQFSIDDFGTGFSSLSYLTKLPVSTLKIDQTFIKAIENVPFDVMTPDKKLIKAMVELAHSIDLQCVAEGVETPSQLAYLRDIRCDHFQGYLLSRPTSPQEIITLLKGKL